MKKFRTETHEVQVAEGCYCDTCQRYVASEDTLEHQEMLHLRVNGGYASVLGDGSRWELDLCQHCMKKILGPYLREVTNDDESAL
jgi:hypothetical protein